MTAFLPLVMGSGAPAAWTFMLYMAGDNNLAHYMERTVSQLEALPYSPRVRVVVYIDTPDGLYSDYGQYGRFQFAQDTGWGKFIREYVGNNWLVAAQEPLRPDMLEVK